MDKLKKFLDNKLIIGRDEWCQLPQLNIPALKTKIDTGAKTSALHALNIESKLEQDINYVYFDVNPIQSNNKIVIHCKAPIIDNRYITSSNGHKEHRYVINTLFGIGEYIWEIELTLSNRDPMRYRMLLGREAMSNRVLVNPALSCNHGKLSKNLLFNTYEI